MSFLGEVMSVVAQAHATDTDKGGNAYILHCIEVMRGAKHQGIVCEVELGVALAHDVGEDHPEYLSQLMAIAEKYGVREKFETGLKMLTRRDGETYRQFIWRIAHCGLVWVIKIKKADLKHNSCITRLKGVGASDISRMKKYHRSWVELTEAQAKLND